MFKRISRLFVIKTRFEVYFVIFAIAMGAIERGRHYMEIYPGTSGSILALAATGVVFLAGAKLLDSVRPVGNPRAPVRVAARRRRVSRNRPRRDPRHSVAQINAGPRYGSAADQSRAQIKCAIGIGESR